MKKRFVTYSSWSMGIESSWMDDNGKERPFWIIYDKKANRELLDMQDERSDALDEADRLNKQWSKGELDESKIAYHVRE